MTFYPTLDVSEVVIKLIVAASLGALIGLERKLKFSPVGIKTYSIVSLGAALFTVIASSIERPELAVGVITGVGFLGAGSIFRSKVRVTGLTTAALIWISAAIGMGVAFGYYEISIVTTLILYVILIIIGYVERRIEKIAEDGLDIKKTGEAIEKLANILAKEGIHMQITKKAIEKLGKGIKIKKK